MRNTLGQVDILIGGYSRMATSINFFMNAIRSIQTSLLTISEVAATSPKKPGPLATFPTFPIAFATDFQKHERNCSRDKKRHPQMEPSVD